MTYNYLGKQTKRNPPTFAAEKSCVAAATMERQNV